MTAVTTAFDAETAIEPIGELSWRTELTANWNIGENPNGGYLQAPLLRAMLSVSGQPDPLTVTTHFLRPGQAGPATLEVEIVRIGRTVGTVRGRLVQDGKVRIESLAAFSDLSDPSAIVDIPTPMPTIPPPRECTPRQRLRQGVELPLMDRVEVRVHPDHTEPGGQPAEITGWIRFVDGRAPDTSALTLFADAFPPPIFMMAGAIGWVPTIELTVQLRRRPADGWILGHFVTSDAAGNRTIEEGRLWDSTGQIVALARQVGIVLSARDQ